MLPLDENEGFDMDWRLPREGSLAGCPGSSPILLKAAAALLLALLVAVVGLVVAKPPAPWPWSEAAASFPPPSQSIGIAPFTDKI